MNIWEKLKNLLKCFLPLPARSSLRETGNLDRKLAYLQNTIEVQSKNLETLTVNCGRLQDQAEGANALLDSLNRRNLSIYYEWIRDHPSSVPIKGFIGSIPNSEKKPIGVYYYQYPNFGDLLNELLIRELFGEQVDAHFEEFTSADLIGIGSILDRLFQGAKIFEKDQELQKKANISKPIHIWGTGLMYQYGQPLQPPVRNLIVHALRGELTRTQLCTSFGFDLQCPLADPGLLASYIVPAEEKRWKVGIIPHYVDESNPVFENMKNYYQDAVLINVHNDPVSVLRQISQCETILSTSLHGVITADSYNIPNCWCVASERILGSGYKYHDYFSSFGSDREAFHLNKNNSFPDLDLVCKTSFRDYREVKRKQIDLICAFPYGAL